MTPIEIRKYLQERKLATLHDIALHFRMSTDATRPMLDIWIKKGKVDPATIETYEWLT